MGCDFEDQNMKRDMELIKKILFVVEEKNIFYEFFFFFEFGI